ncbi:MULTISPECIES: response regulator [unclassified Janthinobacterium]|uniref:response regulator n=1 Tax=unclassified Janthinobacterium TaxID=2610881 RepID=UPI001621ED9D|nr:MULTISPECIES: response regulator [unclassified Janthinobacterium]MBB5606277.1 signal transduction histidine kinase/DNA-binding response OmpR family regulator/CHASE3 domain sensor protein [Janthinobacterium sp. S3T4]MBB5611851.1 signal transduction histidine kinase/DNA-binding response OmpR family regulator/CHASE3 domain sensor protein [Janthinobacterium sp. S3M3]
MNTKTPIDTFSFRRILARNVTLPLIVGVVTALVFVGLIAYLLSSLRSVEHSERVIGNANEVMKLSVDLETGMRGYLLTGDETFLAPYKSGKAKIAVEMSTLLELVADSPMQVDRLRRIRALQGQWMDYAESVIAQRRNNQEFLVRVRQGEGKLEFDEIRREFLNFITMEQRLRQERSDQAENGTTFTVLVFLFLSLGLSGLLAYLGRRELLQLSSIYNEALEQRGKDNDVLQEQAWLRTGQTELAEHTRGQLALQQLGRQVLDFLARRLEVAVATLYVVDDDGSLRRAAVYGFTEQGAREKQVFKLGEGLVGETAREKRLKHIRQVPGNYLTVHSSVGHGAPLELVLLPVDNEGTVNGVIELAFTHPVDKRDLELLRLIAANVGTSVEAAQYRQRLQNVLEETQQLNEELEVQQEELRTANEELGEQSRVLEQSQAHLETQKTALEHSNEQLAVQALALDQKNMAIVEAHTQLEARAEELQKASRYKSEFLANMSHELRTPLNSSLILSKLLADNSGGNLTPEQVTFAQTIYSAGNDLLTLINDILDISKVEAGKLELVPESVPFEELLSSMKMLFGPQAQQKHLDFVVQVAPDTPPAFVSDRQRLEQILKNLLSNAIKFTDAGTVTLHAGVDEAGNARFQVQDSGIGIASDQQQRIFDAFHQADGTTSRRYGGTGLGLSISRDLAALLGGSIELASTPGQGSTFSLTLPLAWQAAATPHRPDLVSAPASQPAAPVAIPARAVPLPTFKDDRDQAGAAKTGQRSVLVIEDEPAFAGILFDLAHEMHYRCLVAHGADEGLRLALEFLPDAILLDIGLPDRPGLLVLQMLKENPLTRHIPVHIVSGNDQVQAAMQLGAIGYATKPRTRDQLKDVFLKLEAKFTQKMKRILLVEDDERQRASVVRLISDDDVEITAVALGEEALALLKTQTFDCMIIDLKLPDIQGNELLERMEHEELCSFPPVIVYTGRNLSREEEADLMKYSRSIIIKGARSPERLLDEVTLFLHKVESELSSERQGMLQQVRSRERVFEGRRILLVDDDVRNIFALTNALEQKGVLVEIGRNGFEAISKLNSVDDIDLVLMDVMMPGMDGLEATRQIRADGRFNKLPIIAITAKAMKNDQEECLQAGASDYLAKPIDLDRLYSLLRVWMPKMERM